MKMMHKYILHPFLFAAYSILFLYCENIGSLQFKDVFPSLLTTFLSVTFLFLSLRCYFKDGVRAGTVTFTAVFGFFTFGHFVDFTAVVFGFISRGHYVYYYLIFYIALFSSLIVFIMTTRVDLTKINLMLNCVTLIMLLALTARFAVYAAGDPMRYSDDTGKIIEKVIDKYEHVLKPKAIASAPDIYYLILDGYASHETMRTFFNHDNGEFTDYLGSKGFYIASKSRANYAWTYLSLASSLNMQYLNSLGRILDAKQANTKIYADMIYNSLVMKYLKASSYKLVYYGCGYEHLRENPFADENIQDSMLNASEFRILLAKSTLIRAFIQFESIKRSFSHNKVELVNEIFLRLNETLNNEGPQFVFAHLPSPHPPFCFDRSGNYVSNELQSLNSWGPKNLYVDEIVYLNGKLKSFIDEAIQKSKKNVIIIIQADHGPFVDEGTDDDNMNARFSIINAYFLPKECIGKLYESISPVNSFRVLFNCIFNLDLDYVRDESFWSADGEYLNFITIGDGVF